MELNTTVEGTSATITVSGKLTVSTAPELETAIQSLPDDVSSIDIDITDLAYVASAGLRVIVMCEKKMLAKDGKLRLLHPNKNVMEIFDMTGLVDVLDIVK